MSFVGVAPDDDDGEAAQPPRQEKPKAEPKPKAEAKPVECAEYKALAKFLHEIGCKNPEQATACVRYVGADFTIADLKQKPQDCLRILTGLEGLKDKGAILGLAIAAAAA
jgi:hypothetical protein